MRSHPAGPGTDLRSGAQPSKRQSIEAELAAAFPGDAFRGRMQRVEHHLAHLASCFLVSPFREAASVSVDGFGDFASAAWGVGRGTAITIEGRVIFRIRSASFTRR